MITVFVASCAQINPLTGGEKDEDAPKIDSAKTYPYNGQLNFRESEVRIKFDEFIRLSNPNDNIIITPQLKVKPEITSKNKKLKIVFKEELEENTTYSISFNRAVTDITEKNDSIFQFVFSTGPYIDSLAIYGTLSDGYTNVGESDFLMALYPADSIETFDSIAFKNRPTYIGQSDEKGNFRLNYLKEGSYYLFAIKDQNRNLKLEADEKVAFYSSEPIQLDTIMRNIKLKTFRIAESSECKLKNKSFTYPGRVKITMTNEPDTFGISTSIALHQEDADSKDSLIFWLESNPQSKMQFYTNLNGELDTLKMLYKGSPDRGVSRGIKTTNNVRAGKLLPDQKLELTFSEPIDSIIQGGIQLTKDSIPVQWSSEIVNLRQLHISTSETGPFELTIDSLAVTSWYGNQNEETIRISYENHDQDYYGSLIVNLDSIIEANILVELINTKGDLIDTATYQLQMRFDELEPISYQLRLIFDENNDGEWTTGSIAEGRLAEKVIYFSGDMKVKSRWEKEIDWNISY